MDQAAAEDRCTVGVVGVRSIAELLRNPKASDQVEFAGIEGQYSFQVVPAKG